MGSAPLRAQAFMATQALLLALPGLPAVYFHSLVGSEAWTKGPALLGYNRAINREKLRADDVEQTLQDPTSFRSLVFQIFTQFFEFRNSEESFLPNAGFVLLEGDASVFAFVRGPDAGGRHVLCAQNLSGVKASFVFPAEYALSGNDASITLQPWETLWLAKGGNTEERRFSTAE
jgi:sucrose phosphorylase